MIKEKVKSGFTLIELTLAIAFISILVITVTLITNEIISLYRKGYAIKTINQIGNTLIDDLTESIKSSPPANISNFCIHYASNTSSYTNCKENNGLFSVYQQYYADIITDGESDARKVPTGGIFCSGKDTYIWNTGYLFGDQYQSGDEKSLSEHSLKVKYSIGDQSFTLSGFRLIKFEDPARATCSWAIFSEEDEDVEYPDPSEYLFPRTISVDGGSAYGFEIPFEMSEPPADVFRKTTDSDSLDSADAALALYDFVLFPPAQDQVTNRLFYSGSFILGTINSGVNIMTSSNYCQSPNNFSADFSYCAINKFNFGTQTSGV